MEIQDKLKKSLPLWVAIFVLVGLSQLLTVFSEKGISKEPQAIVEPEETSPKVLGVSTEIRGGESESESSIKQIGEPDLSDINAKSFLVFDLDTGTEFFQKESRKQLGIASLTKLMTALVAYKNSDLNQSFTITGRDIYKVNPVLGLEAGDQVKALDVFNAMLVGSDNDAALALANFVATSTDENFIELMNRQAKSLGLNNSHFSNALGFDSQYNYSTAEDLKILIQETQKLAAFTNLGRRTSYDFVGSLGKTYSAEATNKLLSQYPDLYAVKTGYTQYALGAMAVKLKIGDHFIVILVLGSEDREGDVLKLRDKINKNFVW